MNPTPSDDRQRKLSAEEINSQPLIAYEGPIHVIDTAAQADAAISAIRRERLLGFDTETKPSFRKGEHNPPALLQLAGEHAVWIFRLTHVGLPADVTQILADPAVVKAGVANARDLADLQRLRPFTPAGFVDLGHTAKRTGVPHQGLRGLAAVFLGGRISKGAKLTNWAQSNLSARALQYAATDAWIGRRLYTAMHPAQEPKAAPRARPPGRRAGPGSRIQALWAGMVRRLTRSRS